MAKIYLSGPMTGLPEHNCPRFHEVAAKLRSEGHDVYNPAEYAWEGEFPIRTAFAEYTSVICTWADTIVLLEGWQDSRGVAVELLLAEICGLTVKEWSDV